MIESGSGNAIGAFENGTVVSVGGNVKESGGGSGIRADNTAVVEVAGDVEEKDAGDAIYAYESQVAVNGDVTESGDGDAIMARNGSTVTVNGDVTENGNGYAILARDGSTVTVNGNVTENGFEDAIRAFGAGTTVTVTGNVLGGAPNQCISVEQGAKIIVGGDAESEFSNAIWATGDSTTVVVEGKIKKGEVLSDGKANIYVGQLDGTISVGENSVHYLIGTGEGSQARLSDVTLESTVVDAGTIDGLIKTGYRYTSTGDAALLNGATITLKPSSGNKLTVAGLPEGVVLENKGGAAVLTLPENFKGGLQNLLLTLAKSGRKVVNVYVRIGGLTLPEGIGAEDVKASDKVNCAGFTAAASLAGGNSVQVFRDGSELSAKDYRVSTNADGSVSVVLNNDYLFALGNGTYDFTAKVGEVEIGFSVIVTK